MVVWEDDDTFHAHFDRPTERGSNTHEYWFKNLDDCEDGEFVLTSHVNGSGAEVYPPRLPDKLKEKLEKESNQTADIDEVRQADPNYSHLSCPNCVYTTSKPVDDETTSAKEECPICEEVVEMSVHHRIRVHR